MNKTEENQFHEMLSEYLGNAELKDEKEVNEAIEKFMNDFNGGKFNNFENTILDDAYELLEKANDAKTKSKAKKLAQQAYDKCPACFDAILFLVELEDELIKKEEILNQGLKFEKQNLEKEGFFDKENKGIFYGLFETRPYMRGLYHKAMLYTFEGKFGLAQKVCEEILELNENDNLGARYLLMAIYALLENEKAMNALHKKYPENTLSMLTPLFILYYKQDNDKNAKEILLKIKQCNPEFIKLFQGKIKMDEKCIEGSYQIGTISEVMMCLMQFEFLLDTLPDFDNYVLKQIKNL